MVSDLFVHVFTSFKWFMMLAENLGFMCSCDFVLCDYNDDVCVVYVHVCGCCVLFNHGDKLMC